MKQPKRLRLPSATHVYAPKQEARTAKQIGGHNTIGSGNKDEKGDARLTGVMRVENKATKHKSFSVTQEILDKIEEAALGAGELPFVQIDFVDDEGKLKRSCVVCPLWVLDIAKELKL